MSWREWSLEVAKVAQQFMHDYRLVIGAFVAGWHLDKPFWMKKKPEGKPE